MRFRSFCPPLSLVLLLTGAAVAGRFFRSALLRTPADVMLCITAFVACELYIIDHVLPSWLSRVMFQVLWWPVRYRSRLSHHESVRTRRARRM